MNKLIKIPVYVFITCSWLTANSQTIRRLSLQETLLTLQQQNLPDSQRAVKYLDLSYYYHTRKSDSAFYYGNLALQTASQNNVVSVKAGALLQQGANFLLAANYNEALTYLKQCYEIATEPNLALYQYNASNKISAFYCTQHIWDKAWEYAQKAEQIAAVNKNIPNLLPAENLLAYANFYTGIKHFDKASALYNKVLRFYEDKNDLSGIAYSYASIGEMHLLENNFSAADSALNNALKLLIQTDESLLTAGVYSSLGRLFMQQSNYILSAGYFAQAGRIYRKNQMPYAWQIQQLFDAKILFQKGNIIAARQKAQSAYEQLILCGNRVIQTDGLKLLADIEKKAGNHAEALQYLEQYQLLSDSLKEASDPFITGALSANAAQGNLNNKDPLLQNAEKSPMGKETIYIISGVLILLTLILLTTMFNQKNKAIQDLSNQQEQNEEKNRELELLNKESVARNEELARINQVKDRLLSMVAHDIRSPLNALQGTLALTQDETLTRDEFRQLTQTLDNDLFNLRNMLDNMLLWAREQVVEVKITKTNFDLSALIAGIIKLYEHSLQTKRIQLHNFMLPGVIVYSDQEAIATVIRNLLSNAIKFTPTDKNIYIQYVTLSGKIYLSVKDEGIGINPDTLQKIRSGEHFSNRGTDNEKGTGIGLLFCQELLQRMNETFDIASQTNQGTSVTVSIGTV